MPRPPRRPIPHTLAETAEGRRLELDPPRHSLAALGALSQRAAMGHGA